jgi:hypothetical protein
MLLLLYPYGVIDFSIFCLLSKKLVVFSMLLLLYPYWVMDFSIFCLLSKKLVVFPCYINIIPLLGNGLFPFSIWRVA